MIKSKEKTILLPGKEVKQKLHDALACIPDMDECVLLDYPDYINIGDHLIWLGSISYFLEERGIQISYLSSSEKFSSEALDNKLDRTSEKTAIFLNGGGNLGDIWTRSQAFREKIIQTYTDRPIVILPQTVFFSNAESLKKTALIFNAHPDLTIFIRDHYSYEIAIKHFHKCQVVLAPDMAFQLVGKPEFKRSPSATKGIFYMQRQDSEKNQAIDPHQLPLKKLTVGDWSSYENKWVMGGSQSRLKHFAANLIRGGIQRGLMAPQEYLARSQWLKNADFKQKLIATTASDQASSQSNLQANLQSLSFIHAGIYQFNQYEAVITNRLHGHILCILMGIPHVFLPNSYYKNKGFYETWTKDIKLCQFVESVEGIEPALREVSCANS